MVKRKPVVLRKLSAENSLWDDSRQYFGLPKEMTGTEMEKERFLDFVTAKISNTVSIQPRRR